MIYALIQLKQIFNNLQFSEVSDSTKLLEDKNDKSNSIIKSLKRNIEEYENEVGYILNYTLYSILLNYL